MIKLVSLGQMDLPVLCYRDLNSDDASCTKLQVCSVDFCDLEPCFVHGIHASLFSPVVLIFSFYALNFT